MSRTTPLKAPNGPQRKSRKHGLRTWFSKRSTSAPAASQTAETPLRGTDWAPIPRSVLPLTGHLDIADEQLSSLWARKSILSLDGGGVRGYSSLLILQELMAKVSKLEQSGRYEPPMRSSAAYRWGDETILSDNVFRPCHYWDYIAGTSTGGLSAIMLGRLGMTVDEALEVYEDFGNAVFGHPRALHKGFGFPYSKYPSSNMRRAILKVIRKKFPEASDDTLKDMPFASSENKCRTMVISRNVDEKRHHVFRSFDHFEGSVSNNSEIRIRNPGRAYAGSIWKAARATSAAPVYFESIEIDGFQHIDGGIGANNPALIALEEVLDLSPHSPSLVLSIGRGEKPPPKNKRDKCRDLGKEYRSDDIHRRDILKEFLKLAKYVSDFTTDTEDTVNLVNLFANKNAFRHVRLNVSEGVGGINLDDWTPSSTGRQALDKIAQSTRAYLDMGVVQTKLDLCAAQLVETRRRRAETVRWELFATDLTYRCPYRDCPYNRSGALRRRETLQKHIQESHVHDLASIDVNGILNRGRVSGNLRPSSRVAEGAENVASSPVSTRPRGALS